ncbi:MAG: hypothetical protein C4523_02485 [Myxococcales bacterium]|nr:MAG: hypothetical protein C4523_02485 [Myxococcales bacterium]
MTVSTGNFAELLWPGIKDLFGQAYERWETKYTQFCDIMESDKAFEKLQGVTGLPLASIKTQGNQIPFVDPMQGLQKEFVNVTYAIGSGVTREMYEDDQYNYINSIPSMIAESVRQTEETVATNVLNNGFSTATAADGLSVFNASHVLVAGGTYRNQPSTAADLTQTSLEQAFIDISDYTDDQGLKINIMPKVLIVPTALQFVAEKILNTEYEVDTANNTVNPMKGRLPLVVTPFLTDTDAWFIKTSSRNGMVFFNRRSADLERDNDFNTQNLLFAGTRRFSVGVADAHGLYGSQGA